MTAISDAAKNALSATRKIGNNNNRHNGSSDKMNTSLSFSDTVARASDQPEAHSKKG
jgi:hypothetical protein